MSDPTRLAAYRKLAQQIAALKATQLPLEATEEQIADETGISLTDDEVDALVLAGTSDDQRAAQVQIARHTLAAEILKERRS